MPATPPFLTFRVLPAEDGTSYRHILRTRFGVSQTLLRRLRLYGDIVADGTPVRQIDVARAGQVVKLVLPPAEPSFPAEPLPLHIVFEDDHMLVLEKPPGVLVHPTGPEQTGTLANGVYHYIQQQGGPMLCGPVTRLDRGTTGLVLFAKHPHAHYRFTRDLGANRVIRRYSAIVHGRVARDEGVINAPIQRMPQAPSLRMIGEDGQDAKTTYTVRSRLQSAYDNTFLTLLRLTLHTGRTHQIRVHCAHIGHPIVGDTTYGAPSSLLPRQALHASKLSVLHPISRKCYTWRSALPDDMLQLIASYES